MHIVFLNPVGVVGGAERVLLASVDAVRRHHPHARVSVLLLDAGPLADQLRTRGVNVQVLTLPDFLSRTGDTQLRSANSAAISLSLLQSALHASPAALQFLRKLRRALQQLRPTLVHSNGLKTHLLLQIARPHGVPIVWHIHDFYSHRPVVARLLRVFRRNSVSQAIAISQAVKNDTQSILPKLPITVVRNGVDLQQFSPAPRDPQELDRLAGMPVSDSRLRVGLVATYANWKGHGVFLQALARVPSVRGYIIGGPIYATAGSQTSREELHALSQQLGIADRVGLIPFQADPADVYRMLDVVVHASTRAEPFGLTIAEAMACGRVVIVANAGGAAELVTDGEDALCHSPGDVESLANAMKKLAADPALRDRLGKNARITAEKNFSLDRFGDEFAQVLTHITSMSHS